MTEPSDNNSLKKSELTVQEYLSLGYLFLIVLGLTKDVIMFGFLDIEILYYSTVLDVLISPIAIFSEKLIVAPLFGLFIFLLVKFQTAWMPRFHKKYRETKWYRKITNIEKSDIRYERAGSLNGTLFSIVFVTSSLYLGFGFGGGVSMSKRFSKGEIKLDHSIEFGQTESKEVELIGVNSEYVFYVAKGQKKVSVSPIKNNVTRIVKLEDLDAVPFLP